MRRLGIDICGGVGYDEFIPLVHQGGFSGFATFYRYANDWEKLSGMVNGGKAKGLFCESVHATIPGEEPIWIEGAAGEAGEPYLQKLIQSLDFCALLGVPILVVHVCPGEDAKLSSGIRRLERVVAHAEKKGVKIAFENIGNVEYLVGTLNHFKGCETVGYCYDSGHEAIWTPGARFLPLVGDRLLFTHIHDNGLVDDDHMIPFDAKIDMDRMCKELRDTGYQGSLTLELDYMPYSKTMTKAAFMKKSREVAAKLADMIG